jgi:3-deoxy-D-manno-octulosonic acid kinase
MVRHVAADRYLWLGLARTRPWRELAMLAQLAAAGLAVPQPVAARVTRTMAGLAYRGDLITAYLADVEMLSVLLRRDCVSHAQWWRVGLEIARLHRTGVDHADLNAHNILIDATGQTHLIDFDGACLRQPGAWCERNLARLRGSIDKLCANASTCTFAEDSWQHLLAGYRSG